MAGVIKFFEGQNIFVTGATGFLGKVLLEKLLRSCPDVENIFVLIRPKKGKEPSQRINDITSLPLFDIVRRERPDTLRKIVPVTGDCAELGLGLSETDRQMLEDNVSIVFHAAATVRFDDPLKSAVLMNTRGTREVMMILRNMKNLKVFVHVSTTYCNCDRLVVEEILYPPHADWKDMISIAENVDEHTLNILTPKILCKLPNTYTFSKSLAEHVVNDLSNNLPVVIFRPSIVISTMVEPFPGWIDNFNGPVGLMVAGGKGFIRTALSDPNIVADYMPVDICIQFMLLAAWQKAISSDTSQPSLYNAAAHKLHTHTVSQVMDIAMKVHEEFPINGILWKPRVTMTACKAWYYVNVILLHLVPGMLVDGLLKLSGKKPLLIRLHQRIYLANIALYHFTTKSWVFINDKTLSLRTKVLPCDSKHFTLEDLEKSDVNEFLKHAVVAARLYLLKEHPDTLPKARRNYRRMCWLDKGVRVAAIMLLLWCGYQSVPLSTLSGIFTASVSS